GTERAEEETAVAKPEPDPGDEAGLFLGRDVPEDEQRDHCIERGRGDLELCHIGVDEARLGNVMSRELDLDGRDVHSRDAMTTGELPGGRNATAAAELEHIGADVETCLEIAHPVHDGRVDLSGPFRVAQR